MYIYLLLVESSDALAKKNINGGSVSFLPSDIDGLWQKLKLLRAEYKSGNKTTRNELVAVLDELKQQGGITEEEYAKLNTSLGSGVKTSPKTGEFTKEPLQYELHKDFAIRLVEIMEIVKETQLPEFINQYLAGNVKVRREIDAILTRLNVK